MALILGLDIILAQEFRQGNDMGNKLEFLETAFLKVSQSKVIKNVLLDSEFHMAALIKYLDERCDWAIAAS